MEIKLAPSKARILKMDLGILIEHNSLITLKKSSLSSTMRKRVFTRIAYQLSKGNITQQEIDQSIINLRENIL